jgi:uncharacterized protein (TIGR02145 family)
MKKLLFSIFIVAAMFSGCSKVKNAAPTPPKNVFIVDTQYPTVVIYNQTWTAVNYNGPGGVAYNNAPNYLPVNGKLYTQDEANAIPLSAGWRLPTEDDFNNLLSAVGVSEPPKGSNTGTAATGARVLGLISATGWVTGGGTNSTGFNSLPAGYFDEELSSQPSFNGQGANALFICSSTYNGNQLSFNISHYPTYSMALQTNLVQFPTDRASIRFVKDN